MDMINNDKKENKSGQKSQNGTAPTSEELVEQSLTFSSELILFTHKCAGNKSYESFEKELIVRVFEFGRLLISLFLCLCQERLPVETSFVEGRKRYRRQSQKSRRLGTYFGKVVYWRFYMYQTNGSGGFYPLDEHLGLVADGFSFGLLGRAVELATKMSFSAAASMTKSFLGWSPSTKVIEEAVLGLGRYTRAWFEEGECVPEEDGEVLVIQIDSKATPTARESELKRRRGERQKRPHPPSPRHRGRAKRKKRGPKKRRKKGDKAKNGKTTTVVVMYTLKEWEDSDGKKLLLGPRNRRIYASYSNKRHAFAIARRQADKRGFTRESGKTIQIVTDGDEALARFAAEFFPEAIHTLDVMHAVEYLWKAGACLFKEGSDKLKKWVEDRKNELYSGRIWEAISNIDDHLPYVLNDKKHEKLDKIANYFAKRADSMMNYDELR